MANALYPAGKEALLDGTVDWLTDDVKVILVDLADYTYSAAHTALDDVPSGARVAISGNLASKTATGGVADAADIAISSVSGDQLEAVIVFVDTGVESTSTLLAYFDTGTGFPLTPNGGTVTVEWDSGASKIFAL